MPGRVPFLLWIGVGAALGVIAASGLGAWANRLDRVASLPGLLRAIAWFTWPAWLLALWTLWQWRRRLLSPHIVAPLAVLVLLLAVWLAMGGSDRALLLALPALAVLAAFALPTLNRSASAAIDWFSVCFFTVAAATGWLFYVAMRTGTPAKLAANVAKLSIGYPREFSTLALLSRSRERSPGSGSCAGAPAGIAIRSGRAWFCRPAASPCAGCSR